MFFRRIDGNGSRYQKKSARSWSRLNMKDQAAGQKASAAANGARVDRVRREAGASRMRFRGRIARRLASEVRRQACRPFLQGFVPTGQRSPVIESASLRSVLLRPEPRFSF